MWLDVWELRKVRLYGSHSLWGAAGCRLVEGGSCVWTSTKFSSIA